MKEQVSMLLEPARAFLMQIGEFLPKLLLAVIVVVVGWLLAKAVRFAVARGLRAINFHVLGERAGIDGFLRQGGIETDTVGILALLIFWLVVLAALIIGFNGLGLTYITDLLGRIALFLPHVIVAVLIVAFGSYFAQFIGNMVTNYCRHAQVRDAELLGTLARYAILTFVVLIALEHVSVGGEIVRESFIIILAGVVLGLALAFGIGGQRKAAQLLERWWPSEDKRDEKGPQ
jgi:Mechanosensitive ion channel, conserved TM helix